MRPPDHASAGRIQGESAVTLGGTGVCPEVSLMADLPGTQEAISGILPVHNEAEVLERVLDAIEKQTRPVDELLVVLDRCADRSEHIARARHCTTLRVDCGNMARSLMAGVERSRHETLVLFDGNTLVPPVYVEEVLRAMRTRAADVVEWHGGMMALRKTALARFGGFSSRYLWTLEYFLRVRELGGTVVRLDGPHVRLKPSPIARNVRYGMDYAELAERYALAPYFRVGTKSGWVPDLAALAGAVVAYARKGQFTASLLRTTAYLRGATSRRRNQTTVWSPR